MTVALHTMTKNGKEKLPALFESVKGFCDIAAILDTGSTDGTQEWIRKQEILPAFVFEKPFVDFGTSRTYGIGLAKGLRDWILLLDDDMRLCFTEPMEKVKEQLGSGSTAFLLEHSGGVNYWVTRLVSGALDWEYKGVTHEYLARSAGAPKLIGVTINHNFNHGPEKFERDLRLLSADIARDPYDARTIFYLAQTLRDMRHTLPAIRYYEMRARMGGWVEEVYYSMYEAARLAEDPIAMSKAHLFRPSRAEASYWLVWYYNKNKDFRRAETWEKIRSSISMTDDILFVNTHAYGLAKN